MNFDCNEDRLVEKWMTKRNLPEKKIGQRQLMHIREMDKSNIRFGFCFLYTWQMIFFI